MNTRVQTDLKMKEILNAALYLFSTRGYLKTTMTDVAEAVNMTKGGIYHYIDKKEDLLELIHNQMTDAFMRRFQEASESTEDPQMKLLNWVETHVDLMIDYRPHIKIFFTELGHFEDKERLRKIVEKRDRIFSMLYEIIKNGCKEKVFRSNLQPKIITYLTFGMINWFYQWYSPDGPRRIEEIKEDIKNFILDGILSS